jgi:hypothetical protein
MQNEKTQEVAPSQMMIIKSVSAVNAMYGITRWVCLIVLKNLDLKKSNWRTILKKLENVLRNKHDHCNLLFVESVQLSLMLENHWLNSNRQF